MSYLERNRTITIEVDVKCKYNDNTDYVVNKIIAKTTKLIFRIVRIYNFFHTSRKVTVNTVKCRDFPR